MTSSSFTKAFFKLKNLSFYIKENKKELDSIFTENFKSKLSLMLNYFKFKDNSDSFEAIKGKKLMDKYELTQDSYWTEIIIFISEITLLSLPQSKTILEDYFQCEPNQYNYYSSLYSIHTSNNFDVLASKKQELKEKSIHKRKELAGFVYEFYRSERILMFKLMNLLLQHCVILDSNIIPDYIFKFFNDESFKSALISQFNTINSHYSEFEKLNKTSFIRDVKLEDKDKLILYSLEENYSLLECINTYSFYLSNSGSSLSNETYLFSLLEGINSQSYHKFYLNHINEYHEREYLYKIKSMSNKIEDLLPFCLLSSFGLPSLNNNKDKKNINPYQILNSEEKFKKLTVLLNKQIFEDSNQLKSNQSNSSNSERICFKKGVLISIIHEFLIKNSHVCQNKSQIDFSKLKIDLTDEYILSNLIQIANESKNTINKGILIHYILFIVNNENKAQFSESIINVFDTCFEPFRLSHFQNINNFIKLFFETFPYNISIGIEIISKLYKNNQKKELFELLSSINSFTFITEKKELDYSSSNQNEYFNRNELSSLFLTIPSNSTLRIVDGGSENSSYYFTYNSFCIWTHFLKLWNYHTEYYKTFTCNDEEGNSWYEDKSFNILIGIMCYILSDLEILSVYLEKYSTVDDYEFKSFIYQIINHLLFIGSSENISDDSNYNTVNNLLFFLRKILSINENQIKSDNYKYFIESYYKGMSNISNLSDTSLIQDLFYNIIINDNSSLQNSQEILSIYTKMFTFENLLTFTSDNLSNLEIVYNNIFNLTDFFIKKIDNEFYVFDNKILILISIFKIYSNLLLFIKTDPSEIGIFYNFEDPFRQISINCLNQINLLEVILFVLKVFPYKSNDKLHFESFLLTRDEKVNFFLLEILIFSAFESLFLLLSTNEKFSSSERIENMTKSLFDIPYVNVDFYDAQSNTNENIKINLFMILYAYINKKVYNNTSHSQVTNGHGLLEEIIKENNIPISILGHFPSFSSLSEASFACLIKLYSIMKSNQTFRNNSSSDLLNIRKIGINFNHTNFIDTLKDVISNEIKENNKFCIKFLTALSETQPIFLTILLNNNVKALIIGIESVFKNPTVNACVCIDYSIFISRLIVNSKFSYDIIKEILHYKNGALLIEILKFSSAFCQFRQNEIDFILKDMYDWLISSSNEYKFLLSYKDDKLISQNNHLFSMFISKIKLLISVCQIINTLQIDSYEIDFKSNKEMSNEILTFISKTSESLIEIYSTTDIPYAKDLIERINSKIESFSDGDKQMKIETFEKNFKFSVFDTEKHSQNQSSSSFSSSNLQIFPNEDCFLNDFPINPTFYTNYLINLKDFICKVKSFTSDYKNFNDDVEMILFFNIHISLYDYLVKGIINIKYLLQNQLTAGFDNTSHSIYSFNKATTDKSDIDYRLKFNSLSSYQSRKLNFGLVSLKETLLFSSTNQFSSSEVLIKDLVSFSRKTLLKISKFNFLGFDEINEYSISKFPLYSIASTCLDFIIYLISVKQYSHHDESTEINDILIGTLRKIKNDSFSLGRYIEMNSLTKEVSQYILSMLNTYQSILTLTNILSLHKSKNIEFTNLFLKEVNSINLNIGILLVNQTVFSTTVIYIYLTGVVLTENINLSFLIINNYKIFHIIVNSLHNSLYNNQNQSKIGLVNLLTAVISHFKEEGVKLLFKFRAFENIISTRQSEIKDYDTQGKSIDFTYYMIKFKFLNTFLSVCCPVNDLADMSIEYCFRFIEFNKERLVNVLYLFRQNEGQDQRRLSISNLQELNEISNMLCLLSVSSKNWILIDKQYADTFLELCMIMFSITIGYFSTQGYTLHEDFRPQSQLEKLNSMHLSNLYTYEINCLLVDFFNNTTSLISNLIKDENYHSLNFFNKENIVSSQTLIIDTVNKGLTSLASFLLSEYEKYINNGTVMEKSHFSFIQSSNSLSNIIYNGSTVNSEFIGTEFDEYVSYFVSVMTKGFGVLREVFLYNKIKSKTSKESEVIRKMIHAKIGCLKKIFGYVKGKKGLFKDVGLIESIINSSALINMS